MPVTPLAISLIRRRDLSGSPEAASVHWRRARRSPISLFLVDDRPGAGPQLHRHPYPELFIVHAGQADFEVDGARLTATAGDILIAPAGAAHRFTNTGDDRLCITAIHTAATMDTEWLATGAAQRRNAMLNDLGSALAGRARPRHCPDGVAIPARPQARCGRVRHPRRPRRNRARSRMARCQGDARHRHRYRHRRAAGGGSTARSSAT